MPSTEKLPHESAREALVESTLVENHITGRVQPCLSVLGLDCDCVERFGRTAGLKEGGGMSRQNLLHLHQVSVPKLSSRISQDISRPLSLLCDNIHGARCGRQHSPGTERTYPRATGLSPFLPLDEKDTECCVSSPSWPSFGFSAR